MLYASTVFLAAFLLFLIQPLAGKLLLPWFGGAPAVWTTAMLFFQSALLGGYLYAHIIDRHLGWRAQRVVHMVIVGASAVVMVFLARRWGSPLIPADGWRPTGEENPVGAVLSILVVSIGLPFFVLAATSPLLQRWRSHRPGAGDRTYRLYAVSNAGSLLGLLCYPFGVERLMPLTAQATLWAGLFVAFAVFLAVASLGGIGRTHRGDAGGPLNGKGAPQGDDRGDDRGNQADCPKWHVLVWLSLSTCTSAMLLSVTNQICQEIAVVPFLWVLPLALYLVSFMVAFDRPNFYRRRPFVLLTAGLSLTVLIATAQGLRVSVPVHLAVHSVFLLTFCLTFHGELVGLRPRPHQLTLFYLAIAAGGALGGIFVALGAPALFADYWEFHITLFVGWAVLALIFFKDKTSLFHRGDPVFTAAAIALAVFAAVRLVVYLTPLHESAFFWRFSLVLSSGTAAAAAGLAFVTFHHKPWFRSNVWPRLFIGAVAFVSELFMVARIHDTRVQTLASVRNFFGVVRLQPLAPGDGGGSARSAPNIPAALQLNHGKINHGFQFIEPPLRDQPVSYYTRWSGVSLAVRRHPRRTRDDGRRGPLHIGVVGLGVGTLAAYAEPGDVVRFYEINPAVIAFSVSDRPHFTYLRDCRGTGTVVVGDGRLSLERELAHTGPQGFDVLVLDAFSSDSIPTHLLTTEAFDLYAQHMRDDDSVIVFNISNRFLDLRDLVFSSAKRIGMKAVLVRDEGVAPLPTPSSYVLVTRSEKLLSDPELSMVATPFSPSRETLWTDRFSSVFQLLRHRGTDG